MRYKDKFLLAFLMIVIAMASLCCSSCSACARYEWRQVYEVYSGEEGKFLEGKFVYQSINATIIDVDELIDKKDKYFKLQIDADDYFERYKQNANVESTFYEYKRGGVYFVDENIKVLETAGFFNDIDEYTIVTFIINNYIGWDGWQYPVFGVEINGKTYLDFDTGYENILNYVRDRCEFT